MYELPVFLIHYAAPEWCSGSVESILASVAVTPVITVIDNGGGALALPPEVRIIRTPANLGFTGGANAALQEWLPTGSPLCVIGSHDVEVTAHALAALVDAARRAPEFGILGPDGLPPAMDEPSDRRADILEADWLSGTLMLLRRECVLDTGPFDERFGSYVEDVEYCRRARARGWVVGRVVGTTASSRGSMSETAWLRCETNEMLLAIVVEHGARRIARQGALAASVLRAFGGGLLPGRSREMRLVSRRRLGLRWRALCASFRRRTQWPATVPSAVL